MTAQYKQLYRSKDDRMIAGVCGGIGEYLDIDPTIIRIIFVVGTFLSISGLFWVYLVMMFVVPEKQSAANAVVDVPEESVPEEE